MVGSFFKLSRDIIVGGFLLEEASFDEVFVAVFTGELCNVHILHSLIQLIQKQ